MRAGKERSVVFLLVFYRTPLIAGQVRVKFSPRSVQYVTVGNILYIIVV
jgi:hypothetical protein